MSKFKHLLVISHTAHCKENGQWKGWGPTTSELNFLAGQFDTVVHVAPVSNDDTLCKACIALTSNIQYVPVQNRGGKAWVSKLRVLADMPLYLRVIYPQIRKADLVHIRSPANISLIALLLLIFFPKKAKWVKYAGEWNLGAQKSWSYTLQKWLALKMLCNQIVTHNGFGQEVGFRDKACLNPSFSLQSLPSSNPLEKKLPFKKGLICLFTGHLSLSKGADIFIETAALVCSQNEIPVRAVLIGPDTDDSPPMHLRMEELQTAFADKLQFICTGWQNHAQMICWLQQAHFMILPSIGEGWPKVLSEGMAYGCVPISSAVSTVDRVLSYYHTGSTVAHRTALSFAETINVYISSPVKWESESKNAFYAAKDFTYERWYESLPFKQLSC